MIETHADVVKRFYRDLLAHGRVEVAAELLAADYKDYDVSPEGAGPLAFESRLLEFHRAFRDRVIVLEDVRVDGDFVSVRWNTSLTHTQPYMGYEASGLTFELTGFGLFRIEDGRITERWNHEVGLGLMGQLELRAERPRPDFSELVRGAAFREVLAAGAI
jgi:predicted SnoaL-like aldol condensation-catalyzing enzyme